jgi:hypothetical protein
MSRTLERYAKRQARNWIQVLREKWGVEGFSVERDGSVKYCGLTFASFRLSQDFAWWEILIYPPQGFQTILCPTIFLMKRHYLCIAEQVLPEGAEKRGTQFFLTLALIHHILSEKFNKSLQDIVVRIVHPQYVEVALEEWKKVGRKEADYYLRFPLIDETTEPAEYTTYFVIDETLKTELLPIPYTQLLELEPDDFVRLAALTTL